MGNRTPLFIGGAAVVIIIAIVIGWLALRGGGEKSGQDLVTEVIQQETPPPVIPTTDVASDSDFEKPDLKVPLFDFDKSYIRSDAASALQYNLTWFREHPKAIVRLEGHCDKRGTREYNMALGERRATSVRSWLAGKGIDTRRLETISYGKDRLVAYGDSEEAHQLNRRVEFKVVK